MVPNPAPLTPGWLLSGHTPCYCSCLSACACGWNNCPKVLFCHHSSLTLPLGQVLGPMVLFLSDPWFHGPVAHACSLTPAQPGLSCPLLCAYTRPSTFFAIDWQWSIPEGLTPLPLFLSLELCGEACHNIICACFLMCPFPTMLSWGLSCATPLHLPCVDHMLLRDHLHFSKPCFSVFSLHIQSSSLEFILWLFFRSWVFSPMQVFIRAHHNLIRIRTTSCIESEPPL